MGEVTNYSYSSENHLKSIKVYLNNNLQKESFYFYDVLGRRIKKQVINHVDTTRSFERRYTYDGENMLYEYDESNNVLARYTTTHLTYDDVLAVDIRSQGVTKFLAKNQGTHYYLKDALGTVTDVTDGNGNILQHYVYSSFGTILGIKDVNGADITNDPNINTSVTYTGREFDHESGLYYYRARYYDSHSGRFLQKDPDPGKLNFPQSLVNNYSYAHNLPIMKTDPSGAVPLASILIIAAFSIVGAISNNIQAQQVPGAKKSQIFQSTLLGAITGAIQGIGAVSMSPITAALLTTGAAMLNNAGNQQIFSGQVKPEKVIATGALSYVTGRLSGVLTEKLVLLINQKPESIVIHEYSKSKILEGVQTK